MSRASRSARRLKRIPRSRRDGDWYTTSGAPALRERNSGGAPRNWCPSWYGAVDLIVGSASTWRRGSALAAALTLRRRVDKLLQAAGPVRGAARLTRGPSPAGRPLTRTSRSQGAGAPDSTASRERGRPRTPANVATGGVRVSASFGHVLETGTSSATNSEHRNAPAQPVIGARSRRPRIPGGSSASIGPMCFALTICTE